MICWTLNEEDLDRAIDIPAICSRLQVSFPSIIPVDWSFIDEQPVLSFRFTDSIDLTVGFSKILEQVDRCVEQIKSQLSMVTMPTYICLEFHVQRDSACDVMPGTRGWFKYALAHVL